MNILQTGWEGFPIPITRTVVKTTYASTADVAPPVGDPFWIYKVGEQRRKCHGVDFPGWEANGWSREEVV